MDRLIFKLVYFLIVEVFWKTVNLIGASIRWAYLYKQHSFREILKLDGNAAIGLFIVMPVLSILLLKFLNK